MDYKKYKTAYLEMEDYANTIFVISRDEKVAADPMRDTVKDMVDNSKILDNILKNWNINNRKSWLEDMGMGDHVQNWLNIPKKKK